MQGAPRRRTTSTSHEGNTADKFFIEKWWAGKDSNLRRHSRQIYSLLRLTASLPAQKINEELKIKNEKLKKQP